MCVPICEDDVRDVHSLYFFLSFFFGFKKTKAGSQNEKSAVVLYF
jgi:hypothetical protein